MATSQRAAQRSSTRSSTNARSRSVLAVPVKAVAQPFKVCAHSRLRGPAWHESSGPRESDDSGAVAAILCRRLLPAPLARPLVRPLALAASLLR